MIPTFVFLEVGGILFLWILTFKLINDDDKRDELDRMMRERVEERN